MTHSTRTLLFATIGIGVSALLTATTWYSGVSRNAQESPTLNPVTGWKTFKNTTFGFQFKYPANWYIEAAEHFKAEGLVCDSVEVRISNYRWRAETYTLPSNDSALLYVVALRDCPSDYSAFRELLDQSPGVTLAGTPAIKSVVRQGEKTWEGTVPREESGVHLRAFKDDVEYQVSITPLDTLYLSVYDELVSSFEFIGSNQ
jgi:hypothetical protein